MLFRSLINKATPAGTEYLFGNSGGTNQGWYVSVNNAGKVQVIMYDSVGAGGMTTVSTPVFADGTDHVLGIAWDHKSRALYLYRDGIPCDGKALAWTGSITSAQAFALGSYNGSNPTTYVGKFAGVHYLAFSDGLPANVGRLMRAMAARPRAELRGSDLGVTTMTYKAYATVGQSNMRGNGVAKDSNNYLGAPLRDPVGPQGSGRSCWPRFAQLMAARGIWAHVHNSAVAGTAAVDSWCGVIKTWASSMAVARGTYVLSSGGVWKCNATAGTTATSTTQPTGTANTTGADGVPWLYLGAPTGADTVGVLSQGHTRFDPNGYIAAAYAGLSIIPASVEKWAMTEFGQTDYALSSTRAQFAQAITNITRYFLDRGVKVAIGFTCYYSTAESYFQSTLMPGVQDALAGFAGNANVVAGANWRTALGVLATNPASGPGLQADGIHLNDDALNLAAAAWRDALTASGWV